MIPRYIPAAVKNMGDVTSCTLIPMTENAPLIGRKENIVLIMYVQYEIPLAPEKCADNIVW